MDWLDIATQLPVVAIFVGYVMWNNRMWNDYLRERNGKLEKTIMSFELALKQVSETHERNNLILMRFLSKLDGDVNDINDILKK